MAEILLLGFHDKAAAATLSGGTWAIALTKAQDPRPGIYARSANLTLAATQFNVDLGASYTFRMLVVAATNLTSAALYRITRYSDAFVTVIDNTGWLSVPGYPAYDYDARGVDLCHIYAADTAARYWTFEFNDTANSAGYIKIGRLFMPETWTAPYIFGTGNSDIIEVNTARTNSLGGTGYFQRRKPVRGLRVSWDIAADSTLPDIRRLRAYSGTDKQVFVIPNPDDTANYNYRNFLATIRTPPEIALLPASHGSFGFDLVEAV